MSTTLQLNTVPVEDGTRESLMNALTTLGQGDLDFSGENGEEYMWPSTWEENGFKNIDEWCEAGAPKLKYANNLSWVLEKVKDIEDDEECVDAFFELWLNGDSYYRQALWEMVYNSKKELVAIALSVLHQ